MTRAAPSSDRKTSGRPGSGERAAISQTSIETHDMGAVPRLPRSHASWRASRPPAGAGRSNDRGAYQLDWMLGPAWRPVSDLLAAGDSGGGHQHVGVLGRKARE